MEITFRSSQALSQRQVKMPEGSKPKMHIHNQPSLNPPLKGKAKLPHLKADEFRPSKTEPKDVFKSFAMLGVGILFVVAGAIGGMKR